MTIKVRIIPEAPPYSVVYGCSVIHSGILNIALEGSVWAKSGDTAVFYPIAIDLYEDHTFMNLEVFLGLGKGSGKDCEKSTLTVPQRCRPGQVAVVEDIKDVTVEPALYQIDIEKRCLLAKADEDIGEVDHHVQIADHVIVDVMDDGSLVGIWMLNIPTEVISYYNFEGTT